MLCVVGGSVVIVEGWFVSPYFFYAEASFFRYFEKLLNLNFVLLRKIF